MSRNGMNIEELRCGLEKLTGYDMEKVETECRNAGNFSLFITTTSDFQSRIASRALGISVHELRSLPFREYNRMLNEVTRFLYGSMDEVEVESPEEK